MQWTCGAEDENTLFMWYDPQDTQAPTRRRRGGGGRRHARPPRRRPLREQFLSSRPAEERFSADLTVPPGVLPPGKYTFAACPSTHVTQSHAKCSEERGPRAF